MRFGKEIFSPRKHFQTTLAKLSRHLFHVDILYLSTHKLAQISSHNYFPCFFSLHMTRGTRSSHMMMQLLNWKIQLHVYYTWTNNFISLTFFNDKLQMHPVSFKPQPHTPLHSYLGGEVLTTNVPVIVWFNCHMRCGCSLSTIKCFSTLR